MTSSLLSAPDRGQVLGMGRIARALFERRDLTPLWSALHERIAADPDDADAMFDASVILRLTGQVDEAQTYLNAALARQATYTCRHGRGDRLTLLALTTGMDVMSNAPIDMVLDGSDVTVHYLHIDAPGGLAALPPHDVAILAVSEALAHQGLLQQLAGVVRHWPTPIMNAEPERIAMMTRDQVSAALAGVPEILTPRNLMLDRTALMKLAAEQVVEVAEGMALPLTIRPIGTDCGKGLEKLETWADLGAYLERWPDETFFLAPFIDYRGADGEFRKYRIAFIDGRPYPAHLAISKHWIVHYLSAGMAESAAKRAEEAAWMDSFDTDFAVRHAAALKAIHARIGTEYFAIDCGEAPDGRLLFFEADVASIVHALDPVDLYPYKRPHMARLFTAFIEALERRVVKEKVLSAA